MARAAHLVVVLAQQGTIPLTLLEECILRPSPLFQRLDAERFRAVLQLGQAKQVTNREVIYDEYTTADRFHVLWSGHVRLLRTTAAGEQIIVLHVAAGELFGLGAPFGHPVRQESAVAVGDCRLLSWPNALWQVFADTCDGFAEESLRCLSARADEMSTRIVELSTKPVEQRIACALLRLVRQSGKRRAGAIDIDIPLSRQNIADMTGTTLHTVSRLLCKWEKHGLIAGTARCRIMVTDLKTLELISVGKARYPDDPNDMSPEPLEAV